MRILHVSDLHADSLWFDWVANKGGRYDLLVISGDLQNAFSNTSMHDQARAISKWLVSLSTPTVVCSGNHDFWATDKRVSVDIHAEASWIKILMGKGKIVGVDGGVIEFGDLRIGVKGWLGQNPEEPLDVLVTHAPPSGTQCASSANGRHDNGDQDLWDLEYRPRWILCGHIHDPVRHECSWPHIDPTTVVLNTGFDGHAEVPNHWVIDTAKNVHVFRGASQD